MSRVITALFIILMMPSLAAASSVVRAGGESNFAVDQLVEGDFYWLANEVVVSGEVTEDLLVAAGQVSVNGKIGADAAIIAGVVSMDGTVTDDLRIVAGEVEIAGEVNGDLVVIAGSLKVLSTAKITGDLLFFGEEADISGQVGKSIFGTSGKIRIDGVVGGDVEVKTNSLSLGDRTEITGFVKYTSAEDLFRSQDAQVSGKVIKEEPFINTASNDFKDLLIPFLIILFSSLVWFLLFPNLLKKVSDQASAHLLRSTLIGFGIMFLVPIAAVILFISTLGGLLGMTMIMIYFSLFALCFTVMGVVGGALLYKLMKKPWTVNISLVLLGTSVTYLLAFVPIVGMPIVALLLLATLGSLATVLYRVARN